MFVLQYSLEGSENILWQIKISRIYFDCPAGFFFNISNYCNIQIHRRGAEG